jgi:hypothetical protein
LSAKSRNADDYSDSAANGVDRAASEFADGILWPLEGENAGRGEKNAEKPQFSEDYPIDNLAPAFYAPTYCVVFPVPY